MHLHTEVVEEEEIWTSMSIIMRELDALNASVERMQGVYAKAAASNDLTFIKIIEYKYKGLLEQLRTLTVRAAEEQHGLEWKAGTGG